MSLAAIVCVRHFLNEPLSGASLGWRQGQWFLFQGGELRAVELGRDWVCLPRLVRLTLTESASGRKHVLHIFLDSVDGDAQCRLRRRLYLER
jgi:hypothetical protein